MKIRTIVETTQEIDVEITLDEVIDEISSFDEPKCMQEALRLISTCLGGVQKVPDAIVIEMNDAQRAVVLNVLQAQLERYRSLKSARI